MEEVGTRAGTGFPHLNLGEARAEAGLRQHVQWSLPPALQKSVRQMQKCKGNLLDEQPSVRRP